MANRSVSPVADRPQTPRPPLAGPYGPAQAQQQGTSPSLGCRPPSPAKAVPPHAAPRGQPPHPALLGGPRHHRRRPASPQARPGRTEPAPAPGTEPRGVWGEKGSAPPPAAAPSPARAPCRAARPSPAVSRPRPGAEQEAAPRTASAPSCSSLPPGSGGPSLSGQAPGPSRGRGCACARGRVGRGA